MKCAAWLVFGLLATSACGGRQHSATRSSFKPGIYELRIKAATIESRRPDGSPWHISAADHTAEVVGAVAGVVVGNPELGRSVGEAVADKGGQPLAPTPYVVVKIGGSSWTINANGRSYSPTWDQSVAIATSDFRDDARVVIQVLDADGSELLAQTELPLADLLAHSGQTLTELGGSVRSLDLEVHPVDINALGDASGTSR